MGKLFFTVGSGLKSLIGKESITDRNVAIFELVKNSIDAHAKNITVRFQGSQNKDGLNSITSIEIIDDGKGMNLDDINNKWLKVAYSAKKEGTEDARLSNTIQYAGAKGVGRFACDTLGEELDLYSSTNENKLKEHLYINWHDFERDLHAGFQEISILHDQTDKDFDHGVKIVISKIRETWTRDDLKKLKRGLSKLLQPQMKGDASPKTCIFMYADFEKTKDEVEVEPYKKNEKGNEIVTYYKRVNGEIKNLAFDELDAKTIQIRASIDNLGENLEVCLSDRGEEIYRFKQTNQYPQLHGIAVQLSFLDQPAKALFKRITGIHSKDYGNIFVYKNGFRILPYGNSGDDSFGIDLRKGQGYSRFLGNREILGQAVISGENNGFFETTTRDSGFIRNSTFNQFRDFLVDGILARFEKYIRAVKWYGLEEIIQDDEENDTGHIEKINEDIAKVIANISKIRGLIEFTYSDTLGEVLSKSENADALIEKIGKAIESSGNSAGKAAFTKLTGVVKDLSEKDKKTKKIIKHKDKEIESVNSKLVTEEKKNKFLLATSRNSIKVSELAHHLKGYGSGLTMRLTSLVTLLKGGDIEKEFLRSELSECLAIASRVHKFVDFASIANFDLQTSDYQRDIIQYIREYITDSKENISSDYRGISINFFGPSSFETRFIPLDIAIILDNLFSNAKKAFEKNSIKDGVIDITFSIKEKGELIMIFKNYGTLISGEKLEKIFELGYTTTEGGSGLGLGIVKEILEKMGGNIFCESSNIENSTSFILKFI